jgi:hypothetical protein
VHVQVGKYGFKGLPIKWQKILLASGVPEEVVKNNPATVEKLMHNIRMPDSLQSNAANNASPDKPSTSTTTTISSSPSTHTIEEEPSDEREHEQYQKQQQNEQLPMGYAPPSRARSSKLLHLSLFKSSTDIPPLPEIEDPTTIYNTINNNTSINNNNTDSHLALNSSFIGKLLLLLCVIHLRIY